ncbi:MAG: hypothetical protein PHR30_15435 [Gallionellaceae bacterium]|nr:hypothetical protein [Gallionellaceae bacterium]
MNAALRRLDLSGYSLLHTRGLVTLINWGIALAALLLASYWVSRLLSPGPVAALPSMTEAPRGASSEQEVARVFGIQAAGVDANLDGIVLTGVFAPHDGAGGFATFRTAKGGAGVTIGQEIIPGLRLERVAAGQAVVSSGGRERILNLPKPTLGARAGDTRDGAAASRNEEN